MAAYIPRTIIRRPIGEGFYFLREQEDEKKLKEGLLHIKTLFVAFPKAPAVEREKFLSISATLIDLQKVNRHRVLSRLIAAVARVHHQMETAIALPPTELDHQVHRLGIDVRIAALWKDVTDFMHNCPIVFGLSIIDPDELNKLRKENDAVREKAAQTLTSYGDTLIDLALKTKSSELKKFIADNKLDLSLISLNTEILRKTGFLAFPTFVLMNFCCVTKLTDEHFETLTVLIDAGCDFEECFKTHQLFNLFGHSFQNFKGDDNRVLRHFKQLFGNMWPSDKSTSELLRFLFKKLKIRPSFCFWNYAQKFLPVQTMQAYLDMGLDVSNPYMEKEKLEDIKKFVDGDTNYGCLRIAAGFVDHIISVESARDEILMIFTEQLSRFNQYESETYESEKRLRDDRDKVEKTMRLRLEYLGSTNGSRKNLRQRIESDFNALRLNIPKPLVNLIADYFPTRQQVVTQIWREISVAK